MFDSLLIDRPDFSLSEPVLISDQSAHEPDVCLDSTGEPWVAWSKRELSGDRILVRPLHDPSREITVSSTAGVECQPTITLDADGTLVCAWAARRDGQWQITARNLHDGALGDEHILACSDEGAFRPRILVLSEVAWVVFEQVVAKRSQVCVASRRNGRWSDAQAIGRGEADCFRPCLAPAGSSDGILTFDRYENGHYQILHLWLNQLDKLYGLSDGIDRNVQSVVFPDLDGGHWVAWSSTVGNRDLDPWWLTKYATLRRLDKGRLYEPIDAMPERDLHNEDSFQGWEFPELAMDSFSRVWIFGQASHTLYAQYLSPTGWSDRFAMAEKRWGSWKPRVRAAGSGPIFIASMGLGGAQVQRLDTHQLPSRSPASWPVRPVKLPQALPAPDVVARDRARSAEEAARPDELNVYFGDLHGHSIYGDATGDVDEFYFRYRDAYGYDFAALTEHDFLDGIQLSRSELEMMWAAADRMTVDGRFVAFYGYEWTSPALADHAGHGGAVGEGHRHILYPDKSGPLVSYGEPSSNTGKGLLARLEGRRALVIPHHTAWAGTNLDAYDPELSRLIEICSTHGRFEHPGNLPIGYRRDHVHPGKYVVDALAKGHRLGFVGGSDSHGLRWHGTEMEGRAVHIPPGTRVGWKEDAYRSGMTAILSMELTRSALFDALHQRRCYATSGVPIVLDFRINGALMGSEIEVDRQPNLVVSVSGTAPVLGVEVIRQGYVIQSRQFPKGERPTETELEVVDKLLIPGETQYYYVRITQEDGNMAWSSPIWVTYR